ncbi:uncharacterized protein BT62DRAFT_1008807 [Guyanagaster necrorhizus]|uniref:Uncharacterized protein n=1 Tax=Guyanagaster necrorhizus TaxID=856835 RepID=A0A9P7VM53_9AGAR|nr:uncharacterized protein BT62DRAFT_1008807 [Guyanagaster necrorhizus MCA 3950]KAG7443743.1 hypothetical protein BT62DRAFT_1008807 [Guyanagaster necrorhizus MCA 3950]
MRLSFAGHKRGAIRRGRIPPDATALSSVIVNRTFNGFTQEAKNLIIQVADGMTLTLRGQFVAKPFQPVTALIETLESSWLLACYAYSEDGGRWGDPSRRIWLVFLNLNFKRSSVATMARHRCGVYIRERVGPVLKH